MGEIRFGPSGLPEAATFEESFAALTADGYRACEIGFVSGFWLDYEEAPLFAAAAAAADVALSVHAPLAAFMGTSSARRSSRWPSACSITRRGSRRRPGPR